MHLLPDKLYLSLLYYYYTHEFIHWRKPKTFTEKIQWLKINDRRDRYVRLVDKYTVREYVKICIGECYLIPLLGMWKNTDDINWDMLPDKFVIKCNHDGGGSSVCICRNKKTFNIQKVTDKLNSRLKTNAYWYGREWPYKNVSPCILAEKLLEEENGEELKDYKFYCFNGRALYCQVIADRNAKETIDFFDRDWKHQEFIGLNSMAEPAIKPIIKPVNYEKMLELADSLSKDIPFVRVDFYNIKGQIYFGEMTFYPASGFGKFSPSKWNQIMGNYLHLM